MRLLLDTHVFIWSALSPTRLPSLINDAICSGDNDIIISTASIWGIAINAVIPTYEVKTLSARA